MFQHPELREGEVFLSNTSDIEWVVGLPWEYTRVGKIGYDLAGNVAPGLYPIFVLLSEKEAKYPWAI